VVIGVDELSGTEFARNLLLIRVNVDGDDSATFNKGRTWLNAAFSAGATVEPAASLPGLVVSAPLSNAQTNTTHTKDSNLHEIKRGLLRKQPSTTTTRTIVTILTVAPWVTLAVRVAAPNPVVTPQPSKQTFCKSASGSTLTTDTSATTN
jgi:hypothetical protein